MLVDTDLSMAVPDGTCMSSLPFLSPHSFPALYVCVFEVSWRMIELKLMVFVYCRWTYRPTLRPGKQTYDRYGRGCH